MRHPRFVGLLIATITVLTFGVLMAQTASLESSGQLLYLSSNSTQASFSLTEGRAAMASPPASPLNFYSMGPASGKRYRGVTITFFGAGSATQTYDYKIWSIRRGLSAPGGVSVDYEKILYCSGTATLGTQTGAVSNGGIRTTDLIADTLTVTASAYATKTVSAYGGVAPFVFSPGSNGIARLYVPELGNSSEIIVEFDMTGATSGNCLIEKDV
jgi:hypothetical protein